MNFEIQSLNAPQLPVVFNAYCLMHPMIMRYLLLYMMLKNAAGVNISPSIIRKIKCT